MSTNRYELASQENDGIRNAARLLYISSAKYGGDWHSTLHTHTCSELFYVTHGVGQFRIADQIYPVSANDLVIINANVPHTEISLGDHPLAYIALGVEGLELSVSEEEDGRYCIVNFENIRDDILFYLKNMLKEIENKSAGYELICQDLMDVLVILLKRQTNFSATLAPIRKKSTQLCATVRRYTDGHFSENLSLDSLAQLVHVSKYHMAHAFTQEYGISPINYMLACRIDEGKKLLKNDDFSLSLISQMLGFSSPSYFSQSFKKLTGISPNAYRKQSRLS